MSQGGYKKTLGRFLHSVFSADIGIGIIPARR